MVGKGEIEKKNGSDSVQTRNRKADRLQFLNEKIGSKMCVVKQIASRLSSIIRVFFVTAIVEYYV